MSDVIQHEFQSDDGILCNVCGRDKIQCNEIQKKNKQREDKINDILNEFEPKNDGDWGSQDVYIMTNKRDFAEVDMIERMLDEEDNQEDYNNRIMNYYFLPPEIYVRSIHVTLTNTIILSTVGTVYTFGALTELLGRKILKKKESAYPGLVTDIPDKVCTVATGKNHILALDLHGRIWSWGVNKTGQLGVNKNYKSKEYAIVSFPAQAQFNSNLQLINIYAGYDSSFAITKQGRVFAWGSNKNCVLGLPDSQEVYPIPTRLEQTPWTADGDKEITVQLHRAYFYDFKKTKEMNEKIKNAEVEQQQKKEELIRKYAAKIEDLENEITKYKFSQNANIQAEDNADQDDDEKKNFKQKMNIKFSDDNVIKDLEKQLSNLMIGISDLESRSKTQIVQIKKAQKEVDDINSHIEATEKKENMLFQELETLKQKMLRTQVKNDMTEREIQDMKNFKKMMQDNQEVINNLKEANDNAKSLYYKNRSKLEENLNTMLDMKNQFQFDLDKMKQKKALLESLIKQRQEVIENSFLDQNKVMIFQLVKKINKIYQEASKTELHKYVSIFDEYQEIGNIIRDSNKKLNYLNKKLKNYFLIQKDNPIYSFMSNILEIVEDNIRLRTKLNDYIYAILQQTENRLNEFYQNYTNQQLIDANGYQQLKGYYGKRHNDKQQFNLTKHQRIGIKAMKLKKWQEKAITNLLNRKDYAEKDFYEYKHELPIKKFEEEMQNLADEKIYYQNLQQKMKSETDKTLVERNKFQRDRDELMQQIEEMEEKMEEQQAMIKVKEQQLRKNLRQEQLATNESQQDIDEMIRNRRKGQEGDDYQNQVQFHQQRGNNNPQNQNQGMNYLNDQIIGVQQQQYKQLLQQLQTLSDREKKSYNTQTNMLSQSKQSFRDTIMQSQKINMSRSDISDHELEPSMQKYEDDLYDMNEILNDKTPSDISQQNNQKSISIAKSMSKKKSQSNINSMMQNVSVQEMTYMDQNDEIYLDQSNSNNKVSYLEQSHTNKGYSQPRSNSNIQKSKSKTKSKK